ncbi:MAG: hypothetical protein ACI4U3_08135 [Traorella sp.]
MKIRCKECNTVYDSNEKYCPYCFNRTVRHDCYHLNEDNEVSTNYRAAKRPTQTTYQQVKKYKPTTRTKTTRKKNPASSVVTFIVVVFMIMFFCIFMFTLMNMVYYF